jgi:hypothetical protein
MTNMVRYGIFGIISYLLTVLVPFFIFFRYLKSQIPVVKQTALLGFCFLLCQIISGISDEFINLRGMVAFYAYMITILMGTIISYSTYSKNEANQI